jgi:glycosyltransferase involved in cell wall biosynthesis
LKILHIIPTLSSLAGGPSEVALNLVRNLNDLGAEAEILTTDDNGNSRFDVPLRTRTLFKGVPVYFFPRINPRLKEFIISPSAVSWLSTNMHRYDILDIHYLFSFVPLMSRSIARRRNFPYTVRTMGQLSPWALRQSKLKKQLFFKLQEFRNLAGADALHSTSRAEENDIREFGLKNPILNIPLGVETPELTDSTAKSIRNKYDIPENAFVVLFLSRLHYKKRPDLLIEVIAELRDKFNLHLIIAGSGDPVYENELKILAERHRMNDTITFTGFVEGAEKNELLQGSDLFVLPSYSENFGIAVAESLAAGTPVVITSDVQIAEYVKAYDAGIVIRGEKESLRKAIEDCVQNRDRLDKFRANALKLVHDKFDWRVIARNLLESYEHVLTNRKKSVLIK